MPPKKPIKRPKLENLSFAAFDAHSLDLSIKRWNSEYVKILGAVNAEERWLFEAIRDDMKEKSPSYYGIFLGKSKKAVAVFELITPIGPSRRTLKLLRLYLSPQLEADSISGVAASVRFAVDTYLMSVIGVLWLSKSVGAGIVQIYARTSDHLMMLKGLKKSLEEPTGPKGVKISLEGRWLKIAVL